MKVYLTKYNTIDMEWTNLWFTKTTSISRDEEGNVVAFTISRQAYNRIMNKQKKLEKISSDRFYWKMWGFCYRFVNIVGDCAYFEYDKEIHSI